jgi:hypothetical protein
MLRVGKKAIVSFENTSSWRERLRAVSGGGAGFGLCSGEPRMRAINLQQFEQFVQCVGARIDAATFINNRRVIHHLATLRATVAVYVLTKLKP